MTDLIQIISFLTGVVLSWMGFNLPGWKEAWSHFTGAERAMVMLVLTLACGAGIALYNCVNGTCNSVMYIEVMRCALYSFVGSQIAFVWQKRS